MNFRVRYVIAPAVAAILALATGFPSTAWARKQHNTKDQATTTQTSAQSSNDHSGKTSSGNKSESSSPSHKRAERAAVPARTPPSPGMVWVNTDSKVYHKKGSRYYGKTRKGEWMTEQQAQKDGYRASKN